MINLKKNARISLEKSGMELKHITVGLDWGSISQNGFWSFLSTNTPVDLDGSVSLFDKDKNELETIYYHHLVSKNGAIRHSGDDRKGDISADNKDNEVISIHLEALDKNVDTIFIYLNSYKQQDFSQIPYSKISIVEGLHHNPKQVFASFNLSADIAFKGYVSMLMAKIQRKNGGFWEFTALGQAIKAKNIAETIDEIQRNYL